MQVATDVHSFGNVLKQRTHPLCKAKDRQRNRKPFADVFDDE